MAADYIRSTQPFARIARQAEFLNALALDASSEDVAGYGPLHYCIGHDGLTHEAYMGWVDGWWLCSSCRTKRNYCAHGKPLTHFCRHCRDDKPLSPAGNVYWKSPGHPARYGTNERFDDGSDNP